MAQFGLYENRDKRSKGTYPYFIDVQNPLFADLKSRLVIPFVRHSTLNKTEVERLCPVVSIGGEDFVLLTHQMTAVPIAMLSNEVISLEDYRNEILDAIDMLITGI